MTTAHERLLVANDLGRRFTYTERETMLYAISVGMGRDPLDARELPYVFEGKAGPAALPTLASVITRSNLLRNLPIDTTLALHGEQRLILHQPLPPAADLLADTRVTQAFDKGPGKGALIYYETLVRRHGEDAPLYTTGGTLFARGDGGFGGPSGPTPPVHAMPERTPDIVHEQRTWPGQALLYRLNGDRNPLHADPQAARKAGFDQPILHGLCSYGIACRALVATLCDYDATRLQSFDVRFTAPVFPGETLATEIWIDGAVASFRCRVLERNMIAINNGRALLGPAE